MDDLLDYLDHFRSESLALLLNSVVHGVKSPNFLEPRCRGFKKSVSWSVERPSGLSSIAYFVVEFWITPNSMLPLRQRTLHVGCKGDLLSHSWVIDRAIGTERHKNLLRGDQVQEIFHVTFTIYC
jgi:hypothetical protein